MKRSRKSWAKSPIPEVQIKILQALPGGVSVADVRLADASDAVIVGFNVVADEAARSLADELDVEIRRYDVIYKITDDLKATLEGRLKPEEHVVELGMAMVLQTFNVSRTGYDRGLPRDAWFDPTRVPDASHSRQSRDWRLSQSIL